MREVLRSYAAALAVLALVPAAVLSSGCGSAELAARLSVVSSPQAAEPSSPKSDQHRCNRTIGVHLCSSLPAAAGEVPPDAALPAFAVAGLFPGSYEYRSHGTYGSGYRSHPYRTVPLHMSVQITPETGARLGGAGVKLGPGEGWSVTFADNHVGGEAWIGGGSYDIEGSSSDAALFFIRGGLRMAYLEARPFYGFVAAGFSLDWVSSSEFDTLGTVNIGDEGDWIPAGFYFRFGGGLALGNVLCYAEVATTGAWVSDADFITQGWFTTWGGSLGVGFVF